MSLSHKPLSYGVRKPDIKRIAAGNPDLDEKNVEAIINSILNELHAVVNASLRFWISRFVPKMTGRLRRDLYSHVKETIVSNNIITFYIKTNLEYAKRVNAMPTSSVRHSGKVITYQRRLITLNDPQAVGQFFQKLVLFTIHSITVSLVKIKRKFAATTKLKFREMRIIKLW